MKLLKNALVNYAMKLPWIGMTKKNIIKQQYTLKKLLAICLEKLNIIYPVPELITLWVNILRFKLYSKFINYPHYKQKILKTLK